jgi:hypothetical protein
MKNLPAVEAQPAPAESVDERKKAFLEVARALGADGAERFDRLLRALLVHPGVWSERE